MLQLQHREMLLCADRAKMRKCAKAAIKVNGLSMGRLSKLMTLLPQWVEIELFRVLLGSI